MKIMRSAGYCELVNVQKKPRNKVEESSVKGLSESKSNQRSHNHGACFLGLDTDPARHRKIREKVSALVAALGIGDVESRKKSALALGTLSPKAAYAATSLIRALEDKSLSVRRRAALALGDIGVKAGRVIAALQMALADPDWGVRRAAALSLVSIHGPQRPPFVLEEMKS
jgi:HEAT repeat protein